MKKLTSPASPKLFQVRIVKFIAPAQSPSPRPVVRSLSPPKNSPPPKHSSSHPPQNSKSRILTTELTNNPPSAASLDQTKNLIRTAIARIMERQRVGETFDALAGSIKDWKTPKFQTLMLLVLGKILCKLNDYLGGLKFLRLSRIPLHFLTEPDLRFRMYKQISLCLIRLKDYEKAHKYAVKLLKLALVFQNQNREAYAYDLLGKVYFYLSDFKTAAEYHEKMLKCHRTTELLNIGRLLKAKYMEKGPGTNKDPPMSSCEEEDLDLLDNYQQKNMERGRMIERGWLPKGFFSHLSNERGDPKENLLELRGDLSEERSMRKKNRGVENLEFAQQSKRRKKLKESLVIAVKYAKLKLSFLLGVLNSVERNSG